MDKYDIQPDATICLTLWFSMKMRLSVNASDLSVLSLIPGFS